MSNLQKEINDICRLADAVVKNPFSDLAVTAGMLGVCPAVFSFVSGGRLALSVTDILIPNTPLIALAKWAYKKYKAKQLEQQEKERMLREVIKKQQAVIRKLDAELAQSRQQNEKNRQEIENLKKMLSMLEEAEEQLNAA